jgi:hypothetical protein
MRSPRGRLDGGVRAADPGRVSRAARRGRGAVKSDVRRNQVDKLILFV